MNDKFKEEISKIEISNGLYGLCSEIREIVDDIQDEISQFFNNPDWGLSERRLFMEKLEKFVFFVNYLEDKIKNH